MNYESPVGVSAPSLLHSIVAPYATFIAQFIGAGFISGGIVHLGEGVNGWDIGIISFGILLFVIGSYIQEVVYQKRSLKGEKIVGFLFFSLLLSIGVGMASGGTQHFVDTPHYSAYLIPIGLTLGSFAFILKQRISLSRASWVRFAASGIVFGVFLGFVLAGAARLVPKTWGHGSHEVSPVKTMQHGTAHVGVGDDAGFLQHMIPHHQEAVDTSAYLMTRTDNPGLRSFVQKVVTVQAQEIDQMKAWHLAWFGRPYQDNASYAPMMSDLRSLKGSALDRIYIEGMIEHHRGAVMMAQEILGKTRRPEIKTMAEAIIRTQTAEIQELQAWLAERSHAEPSGTHHH